MSPPRSDEIPPTSFTPEELAATLKVLHAVGATPELFTSTDPDLDRIRRLAIRLLNSIRDHNKALRKKADLELLEATGIRQTRAARAANPSPQGIAAHEVPQPNTPPEAEVGVTRHCYVCRRPYRRLHFFYDSMCPECGDFNHAKRSQTADLSGRVALVTGGRIKIGYEIVLKLLRAGASVIATTRFPQDAARRYAEERDFAAWSNRLRICGLDLRHIPSVERFADHLCDAYSRLDVLVNNAAQTVRRPPEFYAHLLAGESTDPAVLPDSALRLLAGPVSPVLRAQLSLLPGDGGHDPCWFPAERYDDDLQQLDLRPENSWSLEIGDVSTWELLEVHAVNSLAPFLLISRLEPLLDRDRSRSRCIVNVTSREGQFGCVYKTGAHPHTNMSKAALNMITRTCAEKYAEHGIYVNSVDTGWVSNEHPHPVAQQMADEGFQPPLDALDGAARVLDPVFTSVSTGRSVFGKLFKDYHETEW